ncbi:MgtC/SapB family protein [Paenibacillus pasadenensis]|uniref:MgtC/SapB family protein n=1 Tax=Paenibacillus pasadenensis TaxID=217090 RepID=UPI00203CD5BB|nr:MgtC/SapB family protein [Paenibacillus pasadenensis]MCM3749065.1 MgtC/SapB family protein [Paenibacillus pasadenensis]
MNSVMNSIAPNSPWYINEWELLLRLFLAVLLGGLVGFEREQSNHAAGLRTNILVCLGSCLLMLLSIYGFAQFVNETNVRLDPARLAAQVITGIGFLGAGTILFTGKSITGLTTAATLWVVAAIGLSVGAGFLLPAVATTVLVLLVLVVLNKLEKKFSNGKKQHHIKVLADEKETLLMALSALLTEQGVIMRRLSLQEYGDRELERSRVMLLLNVSFPKQDKLIPLMEKIKSLEGVHAVSAE